MAGMAVVWFALSLGGYTPSASVIGSPFSSSPPPHAVKTIRIQVNETFLPQTMEIDIPKGFFVTGMMAIPVALGGEDDNLPIVQWYNHELRTKISYQNGKSLLSISAPSNSEPRSELDYISVYISLCNDQRHEVSATVMQVAPTSDFSLPRYISILPQNTTLPRKGLIVMPIQVQDEEPHIQTWDGLVSSYVGPQLNVYAVTVNTKVPSNKNDLVGFIEQIGPEGSVYAANLNLRDPLSTPLYKSIHMAVNIDTIPDHQDVDEMVLSTEDLGGSPCASYPWSLYKCSPVITSVTVMPMVVKDYQVNPMMCSNLNVAADENMKVKISGMQECMDEADRIGMAIEEWHVFVTYGMFAEAL